MKLHLFVTKEILVFALLRVSTLFKEINFVGTLKLHPVPTNWKLEGLAVVTTLYLVRMESTFNAGQLIKVVDNLQSPHGLCLSKTEGTVFLADGNTIKQIELETKSVGSLPTVLSRLMM